MEGGNKGGDKGERGRIKWKEGGCGLPSLLRLELYLQLQTGTSTPERPADPVCSGGRHSPREADCEELIA